jgi:hypothetical protein
MCKRKLAQESNAFITCTLSYINYSDDSRYTGIIIATSLQLARAVCLL